MRERYKVIEESASCHCCFEFTVVDTQRPHIINGERNNKYESVESVCKTFDRAYADLICKALNKMEE